MIDKQENTWLFVDYLFVLIKPNDLKSFDLRTPKYLLLLLLDSRQRPHALARMNAFGLVNRQNFLLACGRNISCVRIHNITCGLSSIKSRLPNAI